MWVLHLTNMGGTTGGEAVAIRGDVVGQVGADGLLVARRAPRAAAGRVAVRLLGAAAISERIS